MSFANTDDVTVSLGRDLSSDEMLQALGLLDRIENRIRARLSDLDTRVTDSSIYFDTLVEIEADAVARVLRNPSGLLQEQDGDYGYTRDRNVASGALSLTDEEWSRLGVSHGAWTITPSLGITEGTWPAVSAVYDDGWVTLP
jgi:hypothetical protein